MQSAAAWGGYEASEMAVEALMEGRTGQGDAGEAADGYSKWSARQRVRDERVLLGGVEYTPVRRLSLTATHMPQQ